MSGTESESEEDAEGCRMRWKGVKVTMFSASVAAEVALLLALLAFLFFCSCICSFLVEGNRSVWCNSNWSREYICAVPCWELIASIRESGLKLTFRIWACVIPRKILYMSRGTQGVNRKFSSVSVLSSCHTCRYCPSVPEVTSSDPEESNATCAISVECALNTLSMLLVWMSKIVIYPAACSWPCLLFLSISGPFEMYSAIFWPPMLPRLYNPDIMSLVRVDRVPL
mmetsp:Transcript_13994/g.25257  ORF Transcript_13994/g.25257 Transcript_13994/m.25257 type:complete len:226 (+) Transcript_13994:1408-2085(+)